MQRKLYTIIILSLCLLLAGSYRSAAQVSITGGGSCAPSGIEIQYTISGSWNFTTSMSWCVNGGIISGTGGSSCKSGTPVPSIFVTWNSGINSGSITLNSSAGNASKNVTIAAPLQPGTLLSPSTQTVPSGASPSTINCTAASGGGCPPTFEYDWQKSFDNINWTGTGFGTDSYNPAPVTSTTYFRRQVHEISTNSFAYTSVVTVFISVPLNAGTITNPVSAAIPFNSLPGQIAGTTASGGDCSGSYVYLWQYSYNNVDWTGIDNSNNQNYTPGSLKTSIYYRRKTICGAQSGFSNVIHIDVAPKSYLSPGVLTPGFVSIASGTSPGMLTANPARGGQCGGSYTYQWYSSTDGTTWAPLSTGPLSYSPGTLTSTIYYRRKVTCGAESAFTNTCTILVGALATSDQNYIRTKEFARAFTFSPVTDTVSSPADALQVTGYIDGLGRPIQKVNKKASPSQKDIVVPFVYDPFDREVTKYLPYVSVASDGNFKQNALPEQNAFNTTQFTTDQFYYGQTDFERSALNPIVTNFAQGNSWIGSSRGNDDQYLVNTLADSVQIWNIAGAPGSIPVSAGIYPAWQLTKNISVDEHGKQIVEYNDKDGKTILKKMQLSNTPSSGHAGWLCTYYIYDDLDNLRFVIQPAGVELINGTWAISLSIADEFCFRYEYDNKQRLMIKKLPGAGEIWMVYDARDRMVMTQDSVLRASGRWLVTVYDELNRKSRAGLLTQSGDRAFHQNAANTSTAYPNTSSGFELLSELYYDNYAWVAGTGTSMTSVFDINGSTWSTYFITTPTVPYATGLIYLPNSPYANSLPTGAKTKVLGSSSQYLYSATFYDMLQRPVQVQATNITGGKDVQTMQLDLKGQPLRILQVHQKAGTNPQSDTLLAKLVYNNTGQLLTIAKRIGSVINGVSVSAPEKMIVQNSYDELGQLQTKKIGNNPIVPGTELTKEDYNYNIRDWIAGSNKDFIAANIANKYFGYELGYDQLNNNAGHNFTAPQYNGNINGTIWKSIGDGVQRKYDYSYDATNRLMQALFEENEGTWGQVNADFTVKMGNGTDPNTAYDANGNIKRMQQWGLKLAGPAQVDDLKYNYYSSGNSNRLLNVIDAVNDPQTILGDFRTSVLHPVQTKTATTIDYTYDGNGNLKKDLNKDIGTSSVEDILYNYLNLPDSITTRTTGGAVKGTIRYMYDAGGSKLQKKVVEGNKITITTYIGTFLYETKTDSDPQTVDYTDQLQFISHEEGRIRFTAANGSLPAKFSFDYFLKDHLGNIRMVLTEEQQKDIYPPATLEGSTVSTDKSMLNWEKGFYTIDNTNIRPRDSITTWTGANDYVNNNGDPIPNNRYPSDYTVNGSATSDKLYKLNATSNKTGLGFVIKVMSGDKIDIYGKSYYFSSQTFNNGNSTVLALSDIIGTFLGTPNNAATGKGVTAGQMTGWNNGPAGVPPSLIRGTNGESVSVPKAYINFIFFDDQFRYAGSSGASRVGGSGTVKDHYSDVALQNIPAPKNGYLYVYVSNESNTDVFFDNLQVMHTRGPLLEETHYYPFGLTMAGISSKAAGKMENKKNKFQGQEYDDALGINYYEFRYRDHDPQIGRFMQIDPLSDKYKYNSTYAFSENKVTAFVELEGLEAKAPRDCQSGNATDDPQGSASAGGSGQTKGSARASAGLPSKPKAAGSASAKAGKPKGSGSASAGIKKNAASEASSGGEDGEENKPLIGTTVANLIEKDPTEPFQTIFGEFEMHISGGLVTGKEGELGTIEQTIVNGKLQEASITPSMPPGILPGPKFGGTRDGRALIGMTKNGFETYIGSDYFNKVSISHGYTNKHGWKTLGEISYKPNDFAKALMLAPLGYLAPEAGALSKYIPMAARYIISKLARAIPRGVPRYTPGPGFQ